MPLQRKKHLPRKVKTFIPLPPRHLLLQILRRRHNRRQLSHGLRWPIRLIRLPLLIENRMYTVIRQLRSIGVAEGCLCRRVLRWLAIPCAPIPIATTNPNSIRSVWGPMPRLETISGRKFRDTIWLSGSNGVTIDFCSGGSRVSVCLFFAEFCCRCTADERAVAFNFRSFFVRVGGLLATLAEEPEDYTEESECEGNADCATDDKT